MGCIVLVLGVQGGAPSAHPVSFCFRPCVFNKFSHFWKKKSLTSGKKEACSLVHVQTAKQLPRDLTLLTLRLSLGFPPRLSHYSLHSDSTRNKPRRTHTQTRCSMQQAASREWFDVSSRSTALRLRNALPRISTGTRAMPLPSIAWQRSSPRAAGPCESHSAAARVVARARAHTHTPTPEACAPRSPPAGRRLLPTRPTLHAAPAAPSISTRAHQEQAFLRLSPAGRAPGAGLPTPPASRGGPDRPCPRGTGPAPCLS